MIRFSISLLCVALLASCGSDDENFISFVPFVPFVPPPSGPDLGGPDELAGGGFDYNLTVVFTNDIHDQILSLDGKRGGLARHVTLMRLLEEQATARGKGLFSANAGDCWEGTLFYERDGGATVYQLLDMMGYDVIQVGNHDHQFGAQRLFDVIRQAFPAGDQQVRFLFGNVNPDDMYIENTGPFSGRAGFVPATVEQELVDSFENAFSDLDGTIDPSRFDAPFTSPRLFNQTLFFDVNGIRIGVFGLDTPEVLYSIVAGPGDLHPDRDGESENLLLYDTVMSSYASDVIDFLDDPDGNPGTDDGADIILAVTHIGFEVDKEVARTAVGSNGRRIDVIVGGHDHYGINSAVTVDHGGGVETIIVQAGSRGEFLGRLDIDVDTVTNSAILRHAELLQVTPEIEEGPQAVAMIMDVMQAPGGVNETYGMPFETVIARTDWLLPGEVSASHAIGKLAADSCIAVGNQAPWNLGLDLMLISGFVFRGDLCEGSVTIADAHALLPLHFPDRTGLTIDAVDFVDFPGGLREAVNLDGFPTPAPNLTDITQLEYFLELVFSLEDFIVSITGGSGVDLGGFSRIINGIQWGGVEFTVDLSGPVFDRIAPESIFVQGVPLVGNEGRNWRLGINSIIARLVFPITQLFVEVEDPPGSGTMIPFPTFDTATNTSNLAIWEALRDRLADLGVVSAADARVLGNGPRTRAPDLTFNPLDVTISPAPAAGTTVTLEIPVINLGETAAAGAVLELSYDATPENLVDNPDGHTDGITGFSFPMIGSVNLGAVPPFSGGAPGSSSIQVPFSIPADLASGRYPVFVEIRSVVSSDPSQPESIIANNGGLSFPIIVEIP